jgi:hypothetical protein
MKLNDPSLSSGTPADGLCESISWQETGDPLRPYAAQVGIESWIVRINGFPDEHLYTLLRDGREAESFDEWPLSWRRPGETARPTVSARPGKNSDVS